jgi:phosphorylase kinase gamma subunit
VADTEVKMGKLWADDETAERAVSPEPSISADICDLHVLDSNRLNHESPTTLQISRLLVVDTSKRYTAKETLAHPFFKREEPTSDVTNTTFHDALVASLQREGLKKEFFAKNLFKAAVHAVIATIRIQNLHKNPPPISIEQVKRDPYSFKAYRKIIDAGAFRIYGHWVKKGENQNRAALFENVPRKDMKLTER